MHEDFLEFARQHGCEIRQTGPASLTTRILYKGVDVGYVNGTIIKEGGCYGYKFRVEGLRPNDAVPVGVNGPGYMHARYNAPAGLNWHGGWGTSNADRTYLSINDPQAARVILLADIAGIDAEQS